MQQLTYKSIRTVLSRLLIEDPEFVFVHSCVPTFGDSEPASVDTILRAWIDSLPPATTLIMPTFTFSFCQTQQFDVGQTPSETGILTETFRQLEGVVRSVDPIYSIAAFGPRANDVVQCIGKTCWGPGSVFELLECENALIVGFGVPIAHAGTILHRPEELMSVPYRSGKTFRGERQTESGPEPCVTKYWVRREGINARCDFAPVIENLYSKKQCHQIQLGNGAIEFAYAKDICNVETGMLKKDPLALVIDRETVRLELSKTSIAFLGSSNLDILATSVAEEYVNWDHSGLRPVSIPFGQYRPQLHLENSDLRLSDPQMVVFVERLEDLCGEAIVDPYGEGLETFQRNLEDYLAAIQLARSVLNGFFIISGFCPSLRSTLGNADRQFAEGLSAIAEYGNRRLSEGLKEVGGSCILDLSACLTQSGESPKSRKYWYLGRIPFGQNALAALSDRISGLILARQGKTARMVVVDLDNTLWDGVIGEEGLDGIELGGDYPGNTFRDFQRTLRLLKQRGIVLAIASKNTESVALEAIDKHPDMVLRRDDFVLRRINWQDKAANIRSMCEEIGLGLGSVCFLDDNPKEREWVKSQLPEVHVPDLPEEPAESPHFLLNLPCLDVVELTDEDRQRAEQYRAEHQIQSQRQKFRNIEEFYKNLEMEVTICNYTPQNKPRVLQLISKTNQFNLTTIRYDEAELDRMIERGCSIYAVKLRDRVRREEIVGVLIAQWQTDMCRIDSFLLSCRVLGYGVETAVLAWIQQETIRRNKTCLTGDYFRTPRNHIVENLYGDQGFSEVSQDCFELLAGTKIIQSPAWIYLKQEDQVCT